MYKLSQSDALLQLRQSGKMFIPLFTHNQLSVEIYRPHLTDDQTPHDRDEFYLIISGNGIFEMEGETTSFQEGDFLFVPAFAEHRFLSFSGDFVTWVFFVGE